MEIAVVFFMIALVGLLGLLVDFFVEGVYMTKNPGVVANACVAIIATSGTGAILALVIFGLNK